MSNPFAFGHALEPDQLVDREREVRAVAAAMLEHNKLFLVGPRRFGKTSILRAAEAEAVKAGAVVLRYDVEAYPGLESLVRAIIVDTARHLKGPASRVAATVREVFSSLRPGLKFDAVQQSWSATLDVAKSDGSAAQSAPLLLDALHGLAKAAEVLKDRPVALVFDEFQRVMDLGGGDTIERQMRAIVQQQSRVGYIFAGSRTTVLNDMTLNPARPFYRLGARLFLGPIPRNEFGPFLHERFAETGLQISPKAVTRIFDLAQDVPYNVQALAHEAWALLQEEGRKRLTPALVQRALQQLVESDASFYGALWNQLTVIQQRTLLAAVREGGTKLLSREITTRYQVAANAMRQALQALEGRDILRQDETVDGMWWRLEDPFLATWLERVSVP